MLEIVLQCQIPTATSVPATRVNQTSLCRPLHPLSAAHPTADCPPTPASASVPDLSKAQHPPPVHPVATFQQTPMVTQPVAVTSRLPPRQ